MQNLYAQVNELLAEPDPLLHHAVEQPQEVAIADWVLNCSINSCSELYEIIDIDQWLDENAAVQRNLPEVNGVRLPSALNTNELWLQTVHALETDDNGLLTFIKQ